MEVRSGGAPVADVTVDSESGADWAGPIPAPEPGAMGPVAPAALSNAFATEPLGGLWYINIHSNLYPGGEIRGKVTLVPEPGTLLLLAGGISLLAMRRTVRAAAR